MSIESEPSNGSPEFSDPVADSTPAETADVAPAQAEAAVLSPQEMDCYECRSCGYSYEPVKGDNQAKIPKGVVLISGLLLPSAGDARCVGLLKSSSAILARSTLPQASRKTWTTVWG